MALQSPAHPAILAPAGTDPRAIDAGAPEHREGLLATERAGPQQRRMALIALVVSLLVFAGVATAARVAVLAIGLTLLATAGNDLLPAVMIGNGYTPVLSYVTGTVWAISVVALVALALNRPYSLLDLWLIVVMVAWLCDIALSAILNAHRFDVGFYAGRVYGLAAASFVLVVLLIEIGALQLQLATAQAQLE